MRKFGGEQLDIAYFAHTGMFFVMHKAEFSVRQVGLWQALINSG